MQINYKDRCVKDRARVSYDPTPGCSYMVGQPCSSLKGIPKYGPIMYAVCKVGVWIACNFSTTRICTEWEAVPVCEY